MYRKLIESDLIMGGTQGRYGSTSVENIDEFFFHDCKLN